MSYVDPVEPDPYAYYARKIIQKDMDAITLHSGNEEISMNWKRAKPAISSTEDTNVGIIGAGIGGLYTALILQSLEIPHEILEASPRVGGRLYTHYFNNNPGDCQYYDVGAMRFPNIPLMRRLFNLFDTLEITPNLIPYFFDPQEENGFLMYNKVRHRKNELPPGDPFEFEALGVESAYLNVGAEVIVDDVMRPFYQGLLDDLMNGGHAGWEKMMAKDYHTTRSYMAVDYRGNAELGIPKKPIPTNTINWLETMDKSSGWYNRAFTETVLEAMAFGATSERPDWFCIPGGSSILAKKCAAKLERKSIKRNTPVAAISLIPNEIDNDIKDPTALEVRDTNGVTRRYSHVVSTVPLRCLRAIDLTNLPINPHQRAAARQLQYGPSIKIGIQFNSAWWSYEKDLNGQKVNLVGGQSFSDYPVRTVVYPSYGLPGYADGGNAVLIASYAWTEDADFWNSFIADFDHKHPINDQLTTLVLRDLATIHNMDVQTLRDQVVDVFPWDWSASKYSMGAFAFFGPGQFHTLYPQLTIPDGSGRFHFAGEAISPRHAWVVGALDSAWRAVDEILMLSPTWNHKRSTFHERWGRSQDWFDPGKLGKPEEIFDAAAAAAADLHKHHLCVNCPSLFRLE